MSKIDTTPDQLAISEGIAPTPVPWRRWLVVFYCFDATTSLLFTSAVWVIYLASRGYSPLAIGLFETVFHIAKFVAEVPTSIFTAAAPFIMRHLPQRWLIPLFVGMEIVGLFCMSVPQTVISLFGYLVLFQASVAVLAPAISTYINERSPEAQRATIISLQTGLFSAAMIVLFPLFGLGITQVAYSTVYLWTLEGLITGSIAVGILVWILKRRT